MRKVALRLAGLLDGCWTVAGRSTGMAGRRGSNSHSKTQALSGGCRVCKCECDGIRLEDKLKRKPDGQPGHLRVKKHGMRRIVGELRRLSRVVRFRIRLRKVMILMNAIHKRN